MPVLPKFECGKRSDLPEIFDIYCGELVRVELQGKFRALQHDRYPSVNLEPGLTSLFLVFPTTWQAVKS